VVLGGNLVGELGLGDATNRFAPRRVGTRRGWDHVATGETHTCGVRTNNTLWCWGNNGIGQLGLGDFKYRLLPRKV
jgi:alpha-tubulin suppressor-like RCC1 family protein